MTTQRYIYCIPFPFLLPSVHSNVDPTLNIRNLSHALVDVTDYYGLGIKLGLPSHELKKIEADHQGVNRRKMEVLDLWLQESNPQWKHLIAALPLINMRNTARKIQGALQRGEYTGMAARRLCLYIGTF